MKWAKKCSHRATIASDSSAAENSTFKKHAIVQVFKRLHLVGMKWFGPVVFCLNFDFFNEILLNLKKLAIFFSFSFLFDFFKYFVCVKYI